MILAGRESIDLVVKGDYTGLCWCLKFAKAAAGPVEGAIGEAGEAEEVGVGSCSGATS